MNTAIIGTSRKENEKRVAIHPKQIKSIPEAVRKQLFFEKGYGVPFGVPDETITALTGNRTLERSVLFKNFHAFIIPKPVEEDFNEMDAGSIIWGWIHAVQQTKIAQIAIDKKMTFVAWENMYYKGTRNRVHIFQKNNEMAGYCGVQNALQIRGIDGNFGEQRKVFVIGFGSASRGAVYALKGHGFNDITVLTNRPSYLVSDRFPGVKYKHFSINAAGNYEVENNNAAPEPMADVLAQADIIVNGVLQDPTDPAVFIRESDIGKFAKECLIIDISCDAGMGFSFAHPTDTENPVFKLGNIIYYSLDHTPTLLWDSSTWEISSSLLPFLTEFVEGGENEVLNDAVDIKNGIILNKEILKFQHRSPIYPYNQMEKEVNFNSLYPENVMLRRSL